MPDYRDTRGNRIRLGAEVGSGGEGAVYRVQGNRRQVAKIWHDPTSRAGEKIAVMVRQRPAAATATHGGGMFGVGRSRAHLPFAWPDDVLRDDAGRIVGFLMPYFDLSQFRESQAFFNPAARRRTERELGASFDDSHLLQMARNLAEAVRQIHAAGHVIGDVNEKNVLVNARSEVIIVDIDAIQISDPNSGRLYRCTVGREDYTPPRLQGVRFSEIDRGPNDDLFGLAVLIFKLVMGGYHPYMSRIAPDDEDAVTELGEKIRNGYFPYNEDNTVPDDYKQPVAQYQENWDNLRQEIKHLFCEAFDPFLLRTGTGRPGPEDWIRALDRAIELHRQQGTRRPRVNVRRRSRNRGQPSGQNPAPSPSGPAYAPPQAGQTPTSTPTLSRTVRLIMAASVVGVLAMVASCAFLGGLVPVLGSIGAGSSAPPAAPTSVPVAAVVEPTATPTAEPTPVDTPAPTNTPLPPITNTPLPPPTATPDIPAMVAAAVAASQPTSTPLPTPPPTPTPTALPTPTSTPVPTATPVPPAPTPTPVPYPDPVLLEQRGSLPSDLTRVRGDGQYVSGCFVGDLPRRKSWFYLADWPSTTLEHARNPILLDYQHSVPKGGLRELLPGKCYYVGPIFYQNAQAERRCPDSVYDAAKCAGDEISQTFDIFVTERPLQEITEPPSFD